MSRKQRILEQIYTKESSPEEYFSLMESDSNKDATNEEFSTTLTGKKEHFSVPEQEAKAELKSDFRFYF